ncbi:hypothetical protein [Nonomuraea sp. 10N515B]|uniref:hypothetical protein n=1 Tax=Nonomuraea sp. 10N515B TaxID=3457422 RepID=UPI003FCD21AE
MHERAQYSKVKADSDIIEDGLEPSVERLTILWENQRSALARKFFSGMGASVDVKSCGWAVMVGSSLCLWRVQREEDNAHEHRKRQQGVERVTGIEPARVSPISERSPCGRLQR